MIFSPSWSLKKRKKKEKEPRKENRKCKTVLRKETYISLSIYFYLYLHIYIYIYIYIYSVHLYILYSTSIFYIYIFYILMLVFRSSNNDFIYSICDVRQKLTVAYVTTLDTEIFLIFRDYWKKLSTTLTTINRVFFQYIHFHTFIHFQSKL